MVCGQLVNVVPDLDGKFAAAVQVMDEARHVEVFARYLDKVGHRYPIDPDLQAIVDQILAETDWEAKCVGMQVILESVALGFFRSGTEMAREPVLASFIGRRARGRGAPRRVRRALARSPHSQSAGRRAPPPRGSRLRERAAHRRARRQAVVHHAVRGAGARRRRHRHLRADADEGVDGSLRSGSRRARGSAHAHRAAEPAARRTDSRAPSARLSRAGLAHRSARRRSRTSTRGTPTPRRRARSSRRRGGVRSRPEADLPARRAGAERGSRGAPTPASSARSASSSWSTRSRAFSPISPMRQTAPGELPEAAADLDPVLAGAGGGRSVAPPPVRRAPAAPHRHRKRVRGRTRGSKPRVEPATRLAAAARRWRSKRAASLRPRCRARGEPADRGDGCGVVIDALASEVTRRAGPGRGTSSWTGAPGRAPAAKARRRRKDRRQPRAGRRALLRRAVGGVHPPGVELDRRPAERRDAVEHEQRAGLACRRGDGLDRLTRAGGGLGVDAGDERRPHPLDGRRHGVLQHAAPLGVHPRTRAPQRVATSHMRSPNRPATPTTTRRPAPPGSRSRPPCRRCRSPRAAGSAGCGWRRGVAAPPARR